jgi:predicted RNA binding protein YcfA (HicA-like mRNA interferase family)
MKLPRDLSGQEIVNGLRRVGYESVRQKGDHVYMTTARNGEHHVAIPLHRAVRVGTLASILGAVADHLGISREELFREMKL